jgi:hypothetical protein
VAGLGWCHMVSPRGAMCHPLISPSGHPNCQINLTHVNACWCHIIIVMLTSPLHRQLLMSACTDVDVTMLTLTGLTKTLTVHNFFVQTPFEVSFASLEIFRRALQFGAIFAEI